jgi:3-methylfumaryl-CoA hydratase
MNKNLKDWIGREEFCEDVIDELRIKQALSFINTKIKNNNLPILFHLFFANNISRLNILDNEGHEKLGDFIPDVKKYGDYSKRMWASGSFVFEGNIKIGENITRISKITSIEEKQGRSGNLIFVTIERVVKSKSGKIIELRTIVYKSHDPEKLPFSLQIEPQPNYKLIEKWTPVNIELFRFSCLTWNSHKIHFDYNHCTAEENYPDILVHGPFTAMRMALIASRNKTIKVFSFKGFQALYVNKVISFNSSQDLSNFQAVNFHNQLAMTSKIEF